MTELGPDWVPDAEGYPHREAARVVLFDPRGRILLARGHDADQPQRHWWFTIGGGLEAGESPRVAAVREMREETGLTVHAPRLCGIKQFQTDADERYIVLLFKTDRFSGTLRSSEEGEMVWVERDALDAYPLVEDFRELLSVFDRDDLTEFQYERAPGTSADWRVRLY